VFITLFVVDAAIRLVTIGGVTLVQFCILKPPAELFLQRLSEKGSGLIMLDDDL